MRVIEEHMIDAIKKGRDWSERNTRVRFRQNGFVVWLYSTPIFAEINGGIYVCDGGWRTRTTASRLRALGVPYSTNKQKCARNGVWVMDFNEMMKVI